MRGLEADFKAVLDRRLAPRAAGPLCVALSGGGDSLALLILTVDWARPHGRKVLALAVDHGLHPDSGAWTGFALDAARRLGAEAQGLAWTGDKPAAGLPAAARAARHAALALAAREAGASVLLMGHTADDRLEAAAMRAEGSSTPDPKLWAPSPAWPDGRGIFILRPLLDARREALRDFLRGRGETWLEDPSNDNPRYARVRARQALASGDQAAEPASDQPALDIGGWRESFGALETDGPVEGRALAAACLCAAGTASPPSPAQLARLMAHVERDEDFAATLAGARIARRDGRLTVTREARRLPAAPVVLAAGETRVWDGRFAVSAARDRLTVRTLGGLAGRLPKPERDALAAVPAAARPSLPALADGDGNISCPVLADGRMGGTAGSLVLARFAAATGQISAETP